MNSLRHEMSSLQRDNNMGQCYESMAPTLEIQLPHVGIQSVAIRKHVKLLLQIMTISSSLLIPLALLMLLAGLIGSSNAAKSTRKYNVYNQSDALQCTK